MAYKDHLSAVCKQVGTIQPDLANIGGLRPALELAKVAGAFGADVSPHFLPGLFVHLAAAAPNVA